MIKKIIISLIFISSSLWAINSQEMKVFSNATKPQVVRAYFSNQEQIESLSKFITPWEVNTQQNYAVFMLENQQDFKRVLKLGFKLRIDTKLQNKIIADNSRKVSNKGNSVISNYECYSTVEGTFTRMDDMVNNYPNLTEILDRGDSWEKTTNAANGYDMRVLKITNQSINEIKPILFITSAVHAREYSTAELTTRFAEYLLAQYETNSDVRWMLDHQEVHLMLHNNPDGRKQAEARVGGSPGWRKNTNQAYCAPNSISRGADLNRNYPYGWELNTDQCGNTYSGPSANSEPEIASVTTYMNEIYDDNRGPLATDVAPDDTTGVYLDVHSYSKLILWPWGYTTGTSPNQAQFAAFGKRVAYYNSYKPEPAASLYTAKGVSIDTSYGDLGVASLVYELGTAFYQDCASFESTILPDNLKSLLYVSRVTRAPYISPFGPDIEDFFVVPNFITGSENIRLTGVANDDRYNHSNGIQAIDQVQKVESYNNNLPWLLSGESQLSATDGAFDSAKEPFTGLVSGSQLPMGESIIYAVATDSNNKRGAIYSKFVNKVDASTVGTLSGRVINAVTGASVENALLQINQSNALSNHLGNYTQKVLPATANLTVKALNYALYQVNNLTIATQQTLNQDVQLEPFCDLMSDDVENGVGSWQSSGTWGISQTQSASPIHSWSDSPAGNYSDNRNTAIVSGDITLTNTSAVNLSFNQYCDTESGYDYGIVEVNVDNTSWQEVHSCNGDASWQNINKDIPVSNSATTMKIRFRFTSDSSINMDGVYIDDIVLKTSGQACHFAGSDIIFSYGFE